MAMADPESTAFLVKYELVALNRYNISFKLPLAKEKSGVFLRLSFEFLKLLYC